MSKDDLLKQIADTAYNVGFGAKKHFATYDIVEKVPGLIGFISLAVGVYALFIDSLATKPIAALLTVFGISGLLINNYDGVKQNYEKKGVLLTGLFNELKSLYYSVKSSTKTQFTEEKATLSEIESRFYENCISRQILFFSDWYAHYKFFWQHQIDWVDEQKKFKFWRDKVPLSLVLSVVVIILGVLWQFLQHCPCKGTP